MTAFPFNNNLYKVTMNGTTLLKALEFSVHDRKSLATTRHGGCFLQVSGIQVSLINIQITYMYV